MVKSDAKKLHERELARLRKQKERSLKAEAIKNGALVSLGDVYAAELEQSVAQAEIRGFKCVREYLMTLMRVDAERIKHDHDAIGTCSSCTLPLPKGCDGVFKGERGCRYIAGLPVVEVKK